MKLSIKVQYGLQALLELALNYGNAPTQLSDIAKSQNIPIRFLEQLMLTIKRGELAISTRGTNGGYQLAKHPSDITLLQVIEILEGKIELANKKIKRYYVLYEAYEKIQTGIKTLLSGITLEDLAMKKRQKDRAIVYNI